MVGGFELPEGGFFVLATSGIVRHKAGGLGLLVSTEIATSLALLAMTTTMPSLRANMVSAAISMGDCSHGLGQRGSVISDFGDCHVAGAPRSDRFKVSGAPVNRRANG